MLELYDRCVFAHTYEEGVLISMSRQTHFIESVFSEFWPVTCCSLVHGQLMGNIALSPRKNVCSETSYLYLYEGVQRAASPWRTLGIRSCRTFCSDLA